MKNNTLDHVEEYKHDEVITAVDAAEMWSADPRTLYGAIKDGMIFGAVRLGPRTIRIRVRPFFEEHLKYDVSEHEGSRHRRKKMLTPKEVSEILKVGIKKARELIREEKLPGSHRKGRRCLSVTAEPFFKWLDSGQKSLSLNSDD